jgi:hypothetical protein
MKCSQNGTMKNDGLRRRMCLNSFWIQMQNSKTSKDDAWQVIDKTPISYSKDINGLYLHKRYWVVWSAKPVGLNPGITVLSALKAFNVTYSQTSDKDQVF